MNRSGTSFSLARVAVATLALYGLLLQAFLAGLSPGAGPLASGICAASAPLGPGSPSPHGAKGDPCCLLSCGVGPAPLPALSTGPRPGPAISTFVTWTPAPGLAVPSRLPGAAGARGPPLV